MADGRQHKFVKIKSTKYILGQVAKFTALEKKAPYGICECYRNVLPNAEVLVLFFLM